MKIKLPNQIGSPYERNARLYPALILVAPAVIAASVLLSPKLSAMGHALVGLAGLVAAFLLAQLARDAGRNAEAKLWDGWGGCPSTAIFRHRDKRIDPITKARYHQALAVLVPGTSPPTPEAENGDPSGADQTYEAWGNYLRPATRDSKAFELLFKENISYGFRRNLWGMRGLGIIVAGVTMAVVAGRVGLLLYRNQGVGDELYVALVLTGCLLVMWIFVVKASWVYTPADAYARRFAECVDVLAKSAKAPTATKKPAPKAKPEKL